MAQISNHKTKETNIVVIPNNPIDLSSVKPSELKDIIIEIYGDAKPVVTQFPDILMIFEPNNNISINIITDQNKIVISDNSVTEYTGRVMDNFFNLVCKIVEVINKNDIKNYGFNIISVFDLDNGIDDSGKFIKNNFLNNEKFSDEKYVGAGLGIVYKNAGVRYNLSLNPRNDSNLEPTKSIIVSQNAHVAGNKIPPLSELSEKCKSIYSDLLNTLNALIR